MYGSEIILLLFMVFLSAIFSLTEAAFLSVGMITVQALVKEKKYGADALARLKQNPKQLIIGMLIGSTVANFTAVSLATAYLSGPFPKLGIWISTIVMTVFVLIFGQVLPKIIAEAKAIPLILFMSKPAEIYLRIISPITSKLVKFTSKFAGDSIHVVSVEEFRSMVGQSKKDGVLNEISSKVMDNILVLQDSALSKVMTSKKSVVSLRSDMTVAQATEQALKTDFSRFPVYKKDTEEVAGIISVTDLLNASRKGKTRNKISGFLQEAFIIPETMDLELLLKQFESQDIHIACVVDEYGYFKGVVTKDAILKAILGSVIDEEDMERPRRALLPAKTPLGEVNKLMGIKLESAEVNTLGGFIEEKMQKIPKVGDRIKIKSTTFQVTKASNHEIKEIKVSNK